LIRKALIAGSLALLSCRAYSVPDLPEGAAPRQLPAQLSVEVVTPVWRYPYPTPHEQADPEEARRLVDDLAATGLFAEVGLAATDAEPRALRASAEPVMRDASPSRCSPCSPSA
jgi:hypothetical protein